MSALLKRTPFHPRLAALCETNAWERWAGHTTVSVFSGEVEEYHAIRNGASLYDVSPMLKYRLSGPDAERVVNRLVTRDVARLRPGRALYSPWCAGNGKVIEEGTLFRLAEDDFRLNCAEHQLAWLLDTAEGFRCSVREESEEIAGLALQGPLARAVLTDAGLGEAAALPFFGLGRFALDGLELLISRTGFTGDLGFELWVAPEQALALWDRLTATAGLRHLQPIGARALNLARIEAGHLLVNADYVSAHRGVRPEELRSPFALGLGWAVDFRKDHFNGRAALAAEVAAGGPPQRLVGLRIGGRKPAEGAYLYAGRREAGQVTSAAWSPALKGNVALATVVARYAAQGTRLVADIYYRRDVTQGRREAEAVVVDHRFFRPERQRA